MATIIIPDRSQSAGFPAQWEDTISATDVALITGHEPAVLTVDMIVAASQTIPALTPVGLDGSGRIVPAVSGSVAAIGIAVHDIASPSGTNYRGASIYRGGCFNPDKLNWDASYSTDALKFNAFNGAPTPTSIIIRRPKTATV